MRRDLGDFQTPPELVAEVLEAVGPIGGRWPRVLEPTCGRGHFIAGLLARSNPPRKSRPSKSRNRTIKRRARSWPPVAKLVFMFRSLGATCSASTSGVTSAGVNEVRCS